MTSRAGRCAVTGLACLTLTWAVRAEAHQGPPFPLVSSQRAGAYTVSIWTDPDSTDDGTAAGRFWVTLAPSQAGVVLPADTAVIVSIVPTEPTGSAVTGAATPIDGEAARRAVALLMDHEGRFHVRVAIDGPLGRADVDSDVDATYDLRPPPMLMIVFVMPFVLVGFLWIKLLLKRRKRPDGRRPVKQD